MSETKQSSSPLRVSPQPVPKIGKSERTRAAILNAALDFIWSHPFRDMTVNSLMASTGVSRSAFYQYFNDLHDLMQTLLDMLQDEIFDDAEPWIAGVGDPVALIHETLAGLVRVGYQRGPSIGPLLMPPPPTSASKKPGSSSSGGSMTRLVPVLRPTRSRA